MVRFTKCYFLHVILLSLSLSFSRELEFQFGHFLKSLYFFFSPFIFRLVHQVGSFWTFCFRLRYIWCCCIFRIIKSVIWCILFRLPCLLLIDVVREFAVHKNTRDSSAHSHTKTHKHKNTHTNTLSHTHSSAQKILYQEIRNWDSLKMPTSSKNRIRKFVPNRRKLNRAKGIVFETQFFLFLFFNILIVAFSTWFRVLFFGFGFLFYFGNLE